MANKIRTIQDLEKLYYDPQYSDFITKIDAPVLSSTTGVYNAVYGAKVWAQFNQEANVWSALPKTPWTQSGWRVMTARAGSSADGGVAENGAIPDSIKPTFAEISCKPKTVAHSFNVSEVQDFLAKSGDDAIGDMDYLRGIMAVKHVEAINQQLLVDVDTLAGYGFESLDRVCSSYSEVSDATIALDAGDSDIYGLNRDAAATYADAYVDHNSGTDRFLTDTLITTAINTIKQQGGNTQVIITGYDTYTKIQALYSAQVRYDALGKAKIKVGVNGVESAEGHDFGVEVATLYGIPLLVSKDVAQDTISRIYFLDTSDPEGMGLPRLGIDIAKPTQYFEAGMNSGDPFGIDKLANEGMYRTMGELKCRFFKAQGKIRDLK